MAKKKANPVEEPMESVAELSEQTEAGMDAAAPPGEAVQEDRAQEPMPPDRLPVDGLEGEGVSLPQEEAEESFVDGAGDLPEVMGVDTPASVEPSAPAPEAGPPVDEQEPTAAENVPMYGEPYDGQSAGDASVDAVPPYGQDGENTAPLESVPAGETPPAQDAPLSDRQSFFALDFRELDRGLTAEERQAWNSIYASFRGHSALSGKIIGADAHSMNVRSRETGQVERRTMYCVVVLVYRTPVYIPATEMWTGEARPDYVLRNMMGSTIDFIITKVDREGGYAIASRRQAARAQRYFFAHRPDLCRTGARVKCRMLAVGPRRCLVECYGHDVDLTQRELSYTAIADLREQYHPGDELDCIVKGYDATRRELQISVKETESNPFEGAELRHPVGSRRFATIAGKYGGGVFCNLPDGTVCMCNYSYQHEDSDFQAGDSVMLVVQRFEMEKRQMYGKILSKW